MTCPRLTSRVPQVRRVFVFAPNLGQQEPTLAMRLRHQSSVPHPCAEHLGARVGDHDPKRDEPHPAFPSFNHKTWVPQVRRVLVFAPNLGQQESALDSPRAVQ